MTTKKESKDLVVFDASEYAVLTGETNFQELIDINLGGEKLDASMLDRVGYPSQRTTTFIVPDENGEDQSVKEIEGIIVHTQLHRAYFDTDEISANPPACSSRDMITGYGNPGGTCLNCEFNQFGSAIKGTGKACKEKREIFLLTKGNDLPIILDAPTGSLKTVKRYLFNLTSKQRTPQYGIVTRFSLKTTTNSAGTSFPELVVTPGEKLTEKQQLKMAEYANGIRAMVSSAPARPSTEDQPIINQAISDQPMKATGTEDDIAF